MAEKIDYTSAEHAHWRIDELEKDFDKMNESLSEISKNQAKTAQRALIGNSLIAGGLLFYVLNAVGLVEFLIKVI